MESDSDNDEIPKLSNDTLSALNEFYNERDDRQKRFENLKMATDDVSETNKLSMDMFTEDWNSSQFWYSDETATALARQLLNGATTKSYIAVISAPSVFIQLRNLLSSGAVSSHASPHVSLLEFDRRFALLGGFVHYDFHSPLQLPLEMKGRYDHIICDPPFLSTDCQTKAAMTVRWLSKPKEPDVHDGLIPKIIICTGERMEGLIHRLYPGIKTTTFEPQHAQGRLSNEFRCYSNYESDIWSWR